MQIAITVAQVIYAIVPITAIAKVTATVIAVAIAGTAIATDNFTCPVISIAAFGPAFTSAHSPIPASVQVQYTAGT